LVLGPDSPEERSPDWARLYNLTKFAPKGYICSKS
jgi:hypothetical protein